MSNARNQAKCRFLAMLEIARRELAVLDYSHNKLFSKNIDTAWVERLRDDMEAAETLEAFVSVRSFPGFRRRQAHPARLARPVERPGSMIGNLARAERLGWIEDTEAWVATRELRNRLVHEYMTDPDQFAADIHTAGSFIDMFRRAYAGILQLAQERFGIAEVDLRDYLFPSAKPGMTGGEPPPT